jgi:hypothetical protein
LLEVRPGLTRGDFRDIDQHDRVPDMELLYRAVDGLVIERGPAEKLPDPTVTGDSGVLPVVLADDDFVVVVLADDDYDALDVGEGALTLTVWIACEAAGGEAADPLAASARDAGVAPDGGRRCQWVRQTRLPVRGGCHVAGGS